MPIIKCESCGCETNTALSDWYSDNKGCYAKIVNGKWERGCAYEDGHDLLLIKYVDKLINDNEKL